MIHKKSKASMSHQIVLDADCPRSAEQVKVSGSYCEQHPGKQYILYCYDCKTVTCQDCVGNHNKHLLTNINESQKKFCDQLNDEDRKSVV